MNGIHRPKRPTRAESFLGIHFDFHARGDDTPVGQYTTREMIESVIDKVGPDYIECDCKGHHGYSSYPTKVGVPAPVIIGDPLKVWREVTAERGVALYVHYSGIVDRKAVDMHPEWASINEKGEKDFQSASLYSAYLEELMLPQLKELIDEYEIDGVWVDGDCWGAVRDYSEGALRAFREETGIRDVPRTPEDPHYEAFTTFSRDSFRRYLQSYMKALRDYKPDFQLGSSWAFSSFMPEPVSADVDYLTGDSAPVCRSYPRFEGRFLARQGKPWDLMTWSFGGGFVLEGKPQVTLKSVAQLQQEAATIISLGGGYQSVSNQKLDGSVMAWQMDLMAEVARFCRARQSLSHNAELIPQIGLIHIGGAYYRKEGPLFNSIGLVDPLLGVMDCLLEAQHVVEIVMPHQCRGRMQQYPLMIVPEWDKLPDGFKEELLDYAQAGGRLLVIGPKAVRLFAEEMDIEPLGDMEEAVKYVEHGGWLDGRKTPYQRIGLGARAAPYGKLYDEFDVRGDYEPAATITPYGQGCIAGVHFEFGSFYVQSATVVVREFMSGLVRTLFPEPLAEVAGSGLVDVVLARKDGKTIVHLINAAGQQKNPKVHAFRDIPPIGPLHVRLRTDRAPGRLTLEPGGIPLPCTFEAGVVRTVVERLDIHSMIVAE